MVPGQEGTCRTRARGRSTGATKLNEQKFRKKTECLPKFFVLILKNCLLSNKTKKVIGDLKKIKIGRVLADQKLF